MRWPTLRSARLYSCKRAWQPHRSAVPFGVVLLLYFPTSHFLFLFHFCPLFSLQANVSEILQWDHGGDERVIAQVSYSSHHSSQALCASREPRASLILPVFHLTSSARHAGISSSGLFSSLHLVCSFTHPYFSGLLPPDQVLSQGRIYVDGLNLTQC